MKTPFSGHRVKCRCGQQTGTTVTPAGLTALVILTLTASPASAALVAVESSDFSNSSFAPSVFASPLGLGDNVISGTLPGSSTIPDVDVFRIDNPGGLVINLITISFSGFIPSVPAFSATGSLLSPNSGAISATGDGVFPMAAVINNGASLTFQLKGPGQLGSEFITAGSTGYSVTVHAVPEPGAAMVITGALSAWGLRRKRPFAPAPPRP